MRTIPFLSREMERSFEQITFGGLGDAAIAVEITKPFTVRPVGELIVGVRVNALVPPGVFGIAGKEIGEQGSDDRLVVRPPEFHILPVFLDRLSVDIAEIKDAAIFLIPAARPHIVEHPAAEVDQARVVAPVGGFLKDEPGAFDGMTGIQGPAVDMVDDVAVGGYLFHHAGDIVFDEIPLDLPDPPTDPLVAPLVADGSP